MSQIEFIRADIARRIQEQYCIYPDIVKETADLNVPILETIKKFAACNARIELLRQLDDTISLTTQFSIPGLQ